VALPGDHPDAPIHAAISVAAISSRLDAARRAEVGAALQRHTRRLAQLLASLSTAAGAAVG
jgi:DNA-binding IclR family transcriptional regulator